MPDIQHSQDQKREYTILDRLQEGAKGMAAYVMDRANTLRAKMHSAASNPHNESHLAGGDHGSAHNAHADDVRNEAQADSANGIDAYEAAIVQGQGVSKEALSPTTSGGPESSTPEQQQQVESRTLTSAQLAYEQYHRARADEGRVSNLDRTGEKSPSVEQPARNPLGLGKEAAASVQQVAGSLGGLFAGNKDVMKDAPSLTKGPSPSLGNLQPPAAGLHGGNRMLERF